jgi:hypothetical protein
MCKRYLLVIIFYHEEGGVRLLGNIHTCTWFQVLKGTELYVVKVVSLTEVNVGGAGDDRNVNQR